jgi:hypothetical protein
LGEEEKAPMSGYSHARPILRDEAEKQEFNLDWMKRIRDRREGAFLWLWRTGEKLQSACVMCAFGHRL